MNMPINSERGSRIRVYLLRLWWPVLLFFLSTQLIWGTYRALIVAIPLFVLGFFYASAAEIRLDEDALSYRRWSRWVRVSYRDIKECNVSLAPGLGALKLSHAVPPWSKLYFVREERSQILFPGGQSQLTALINARCSRAAGTIQQPARSGTKKGLTVCGMAMVAGLLAAMLSRILLPDVSIQFDQASFPRWLVRYEALQRATAAWPWNAVVCCSLLAILILLKFRRSAWGAAFALGGTLGLIAAKVMG